MSAKRRTKAYRPKTLSGAQAYVRNLLNQQKRTNDLLDRYARDVKQLAKDRRTLAMLAADGPCFENPLVIYEAKKLRDEVLRVECRLTPDGKPIPH